MKPNKIYKKELKTNILSVRVSEKLFNFLKLNALDYASIARGAWEKVEKQLDKKSS